MQKVPFIIGILIVSAAIILGTLTYKSYLPPAKTDTSPTKVLNQDGTINLLFDINNPSVGETRLIYFISGKVASISNNGLNTEFTINPPADTPPIKNLPPLVTTPNTTIYQRQADKFLKRKISDLKVGQNIRFYLHYRVKLKNWFVSRINIQEN